MKEFDAVALFRLSVLGPLVSRDHLQRGELQTIIRELASRQYRIRNDCISVKKRLRRGNTPGANEASSV